MEFISKTVGPDYEISLIDTSKDKSKVIAIVNGHISGRKKGEGISALVAKSIEEKEYEHSDYIINRTTYTDKGKALRTSMYFIKDEDEELLGILKINFDDSRYKGVSEKLMSLCHPDNYYTDNEEALDRTENGKSFGLLKEERISSKHSLDRMIDTVLSQSVIPVDRLNQEEKINIVEQLDDMGAFLLKGAVQTVADRLDSSVPSIYRYLNIVKKSET